MCSNPSCNDCAKEELQIEGTGLDTPSYRKMETLSPSYTKPQANATQAKSPSPSAHLQVSTCQYALRKNCRFLLASQLGGQANPKRWFSMLSLSVREAGGAVGTAVTWTDVPI